MSFHSIAEIFFHPSLFLVLGYVFSSSFAFCLYPSSQFWTRGYGLQALVFGVGTLQCKHDCPHHGARLMPFLFNPLRCIFTGAVLFNGNVENRGAAYLSELLPNV
jgi:hypothetical protein